MAHTVRAGDFGRARGLLERPLDQESEWCFATVAEMLDALRPVQPVTCVWPGALSASAKRFRQLFPGAVLYAVKANPHPSVLRALHAAGINHFDVASLAEIIGVQKTCPGAELFFHNPVKAREDIRRAYYEHGVRSFVVDHHSELSKIMRELRGADFQILVRLAISADSVAQDFSTKFGACPEEAVAMLRTSAGAGAGVASGIAFHVGTQCSDPAVFRAALRLSGDVIRRAGVPITCLDVGGGFPLRYLDCGAYPPLEAYIESIAQEYEALDMGDCLLACEPGRALVGDGCTAVMHVLARRGDRLYVSDGPTGSLGDIWFQERAVRARLHRLSAPVAQEYERFTVIGPLSGDCHEVMPVQFRLPVDTSAGDWIEVAELGAYGAAMATDQQSYHEFPCVSIVDEPLWSEYEPTD